MSRWRKTIEVKDCGNSWCDQFVGCRGHEVEMEYSTVTDICSVRVKSYHFDEKTNQDVMDNGNDHMIIGGDGIFDAIAELIKENPHL